MNVGGTSPSLGQTTGDAAVMREAVNKSATLPVEVLGTDVKQQNATQPVEAPGAGTATQPVEAIRETIRGMRSFMGWHQIPEFDVVSSTDNNPFAGSRVKPTGKVSVK